MTERFELRLSPSPAAPAAARGALGPLRGAVDEDTLGSVQLLVSELVTNAVRHADLSDRDWIELRVEATDERVRVSVADPGPGFTRPPPAPELNGPSGWGLFLVQRLADRWGVERPGETVVWFEIEQRRARWVGGDRTR
jgi:anti-sigma regulatory factor (Ser/Thr protein kinase)